MSNKKFNFIKINRPEFVESTAQILKDIKSIDYEIDIEDKRTKKYKQELINDLLKTKREDIPIIPKKITLWMKIKFLFTGKWY
jgi:hypothetical protein